MDKRTADAAPADPYSAARCERLGHPLEAIKFFRRFNPSVARDLSYTLVCNTASVFLFTMLSLQCMPPLRALWVNFVLANCIGYGIHFRYLVCNWVLDSTLRRQSCALRTLYYSTLEATGVFGGYWLGFTLLGARTSRHWLFSASGAPKVLLLSLILSGILAMAFYLRRRQLKAEGST